MKSIFESKMRGMNEASRLITEDTKYVDRYSSPDNFSNMNYLYEILCEDRISKIRHKAEEYIKNYHSEMLRYETELILSNNYTELGNITFPTNPHGIINTIKNELVYAIRNDNQLYVYDVVRILLDSFDLDLEREDNILVVKNPNLIMRLSNLLNEFVKYLTYHHDFKDKGYMSFESLGINSPQDIIEKYGNKLKYI